MLWPVDERDVARRESLREVARDRVCGGIATANDRPPRRRGAGSAARASRGARSSSSAAVRATPAVAARARSSYRGGFVDGVVFPGKVFQREADRDRLLLARVGLLRGVRLARLGTRLRTERRARRRRAASRSPSGVASMKSGASMQRVALRSRGRAAPLPARDRRPRPRSRGRCACITDRRPTNRYGAIIWWSTATAMRGSWQSRLTQPLPGFRSRREPAPRA